MDKNMIKIDDLLRQHLEGAEERERAGAWGNMRDLLDKQMPVSKVPAATNWRRMFAYVAGVAILAAVSVGGYEMAESFSTKGNIADNNISRNSSAPATGLAGTAVNTSLPETVLSEANGNEAAPVAEQPVTAPKTVAQHAVAPQTVNGQPMASNTIAPKSGSEPMTPKQPAGNNVAAKPATTSSKAIDAGKLAANSAAPAKAADMRNTTNTPASGNNNPENNKQSIQEIAKAITGTTGNNRQQNEPLTALATGEPQKAKTTATQPEPKFKEVPYQKIEIHERTDKSGIAKKDTIFNGEDVMKVQVPQEKEEQLAMNKKTNDELSSGSNITPAAAAPPAKKEASAEEADMQKLGDHMTSRKKMKNYNPGRFEEMVKNAKFRMGTVKFYPGVIAGANMAFNGNLGGHFGVAGNLTISERWAILTEVKFAYTFNNSKEDLKDDYIDNVQPTVINGKAVYKYDSIDHHFNFNSYTNFEVPLLVTYTKNRYIFMAGASFRYNMAISSLQEVEQKYLSEETYYSTSEPKFETKPNILLSDFASSMNISPMIGFGYQCTPAFRLDGRLSKPVWNDANTAGQKEIAKGLYDLPQFQMNLTWRFHSNKPYKRNK